MSSRQFPADVKPQDQVFSTAEAGFLNYKSKLGPPTDEWIYYDAANKPVGFIYRWDKPDKTFRPLARFPDGWRQTSIPEPRPLFNLPGLVATDAQGKLVFVLEGERAAESGRSIGLLTTTSGGGANAPGKTDWSPLAGREIVILPDNDEPGRKYAESVSQNLAALDPPAKTRIVTLPGLPVGGDIVEWIASHGEAAEPSKMREELACLFKEQAPRPPTTAAQVGETAPGAGLILKEENHWGWPELRPLEAMDLPGFPTDSLPVELWKWVEAEARATQTPPDMAALLTLVACSFCVSKKVRVEARPGWIEPVNLFGCVIMEPGSRKSAVFADVMRPLREIERNLIEQARGTVARTQSERRQKEERLRSLEKKTSNGDDPGAGNEAMDLAEELARTPKAVLPRLVVDDTTAEKLCQLLEDQGGRILSQSPEGGVFDLMAGKYSKNTNFIVYLMGHSGDDLVIDRLGRDSIRVTAPALTCAYAVQPSVITRLGAIPEFRERGLLARFLYSMPLNKIGEREIAPSPVPARMTEGYHETVKRLSSITGNHLLTLDATAGECLIRWETEVESMLREGGLLEMIRDWGSKLCGATLRIAGVMHCVEPGLGRPISGETMARAIHISRSLIPHANWVLTKLMSERKNAHDDCGYILRWIKRYRREEFSRRDLHQHGRTRWDNTHDMDPGLTEMINRGYLRLADPENKIGRPTEIYLVNFKIYDSNN